MRCSPLLQVPLVLVRLSAAVRSSDIKLTSGTLCAEASPDPNNRWRFTLDASECYGVKHHDDYVLRLQPDCGGPQVDLSVSVIPHINPEDPLQKSSVVITVEPDDAYHRFFVCPKVTGSDTCLAEVVLQHRDFRPRQLLIGLPFLRQSRRLLALHWGESKPVLDALEWAICLVVMCLVVTIIHALHSFRVAGRDEASQQPPCDEQQPHDEQQPQDEPEVECPIDISSPLWESLDAWLGSLTFVVAGVALVAGLMSILVSSNGPGWLIFFTVTWPATLGNLLLYLFWMSTCRLQLFSAALSRGICIRGTHPISPRLILAGGCLSVLLLSAIATIIRSVYGDNDARDSVNMGKKIGPFVVNPTASLVSVLVYVYYRSLAHHRTECPMSIEAMAQLMSQISAEEGDHKVDTQLPKDSAGGTWLARRLRNGSVPVIPEGVFCQLCREGRDPVVAIRSKEPLPEGRMFTFGDLAWQGRVVHQLSGYRTAIFNPPLALFFFLVLTAASWCLSVFSMTTNPSLVGLEMSEYSPGKLFPKLRPWQTDYELILDSSAHSFTFLETLSPDGAYKINLGLPGGRTMSTSQRSEMVTVVAGRQEFPIQVSMEVMGILGRKNSYNLFVVNDYKLFPGVQIVPKQNGSKLLPRVACSGEVDGSVLSLPVTTSDVEITFYQEAYSMALPVSMKEAKGNNASMLTVFSPMENSSIELCSYECRHQARCMVSRHSEKGCFFIWGPVALPPSAFSFVADPDIEENGCRYLGIRLCVREDHRTDPSHCWDMERGVQGLLRQTVPFKRGVKLKVYASTYSECRGVRKVVGKNMAELTFTRHFTLPAYVLGRVPTVDTTVKMKTVQTNTRDVVVTVTLQKYVPTTPKLTLYFAVLLPDPEVGISASRSQSKCAFHDHEDAQNQSFWEAECKQHWKARKYSICGGWRRSRIFSCHLEAFAPSIDEYFILIPPCSFLSCEAQLSRLRVRTKTEDHVQPAQWSLAADCSVDFRVSGNTFGDDLLTPEVFITASDKCREMVIHTVNRTRTWSVIQYMALAIGRGPTTRELVGLLDSLVSSPFIVNKTKALQDVGFGLCKGDVPCLRKGDTRQPLTISDIMRSLPKKSRSGLLEHVLDLYSDRQIERPVGFNAVTTATYARNEEQVKALTLYIKRRVKYIDLGDGHRILNPSLVAIKTRRHNILEHILEVTTCCFKVLNHYMHQSLWEFAVASGCGECVSALDTRCGKAYGNNRNSLFFSFPTRSTTWADLEDVADAFKKIPTLTSLGFSLTQEVFLGTVVKLVWLGRQGAFPGLKRLLFTAEHRPPELQISAKSARLLCDVIKAHPRMEALDLVGDVDHDAYDTLSQCFRESGRTNTSLQILRVAIGDKPIQLKAFAPPRCTPEANQSEVVGSHFLDVRHM